MTYIYDMFEKLSLIKANDNDGNDAALDEMFHHLMHSVGYSFSSDHEHATTMSTVWRKEAVFWL